MTIIEQDARKPGVLMTKPKLIADYFRLKLSGYDREVFAVAWLDLQYRLIEFRELFVGTVDRADVHLREVAKSGLACNAAAAIFAHNHPSGCAEPSVFDIEVTEYLETSLIGLGIAVLDHWIVTAETATSAFTGFRTIGASKRNTTCLAAVASTRRRTRSDE